MLCIHNLFLWVGIGTAYFYVSHDVRHYFFCICSEEVLMDKKMASMNSLCSSTIMQVNFEKFASACHLSNPFHCRSLLHCLELFKKIEVKRRTRPLFLSLKLDLKKLLLVYKMNIIRRFLSTTSPSLSSH